MRATYYLDDLIESRCAPFPRDFERNAIRIHDRCGIYKIIWLFNKKTGRPLYVLNTLGLLGFPKEPDLMYHLKYKELKEVLRQRHRGRLARKTN